MSSFCKSHFFCKNISVYAIFNDQSFNDMLTNDIVSFEQTGPALQLCFDCYIYRVLNYFKHHVYYVSINNFIYYVSINNFLEQHVYNNMLFMSLILD